MNYFLPLTIASTLLMFTPSLVDAGKPFMNSFGGEFCAVFGKQETLGFAYCYNGKATKVPIHWIIGLKKGWLRTAPAGGECVDVRSENGYDYLIAKSCNSGTEFPSWEWTHDTGVKLKDDQKYAGKFPMPCGDRWYLVSQEQAQSLSCVPAPKK